MKDISQKIIRVKKLILNKIIRPKMIKNPNFTLYIVCHTFLRVEGTLMLSS